MCSIFICVVSVLLGPDSAVFISLIFLICFAIYHCDDSDLFRPDSAVFIAVLLLGCDVIEPKDTFCP